MSETLKSTTFSKEALVLFDEDTVVRINTALRSLELGLVTWSQATEAEVDELDDSPAKLCEVAWFESGSRQNAEFSHFILHERSLMPGDIVRDVTNGQLGLVNDLQVMCHGLIFGTNHLVVDISSCELESVPGSMVNNRSHYVVMHGWMGILENLQAFFTLRFNDGAEVRVLDSVLQDFKNVSQQRDEEDEFYVHDFFEGAVLSGDMRVFIQSDCIPPDVEWVQSTPAHCAKQARLLRRMHTIFVLVTKIEAYSAQVRWLCAGHGAIPHPPDRCVEEQQLSLMKSVSDKDHLTCQLGDIWYYNVKSLDNIVSLSQLSLGEVLYQVEHIDGQNETVVPAEVAAHESNRAIEPRERKKEAVAASSGASSSRRRRAGRGRRQLAQKRIEANACQRHPNLKDIETRVGDRVPVQIVLNKSQVEVWWQNGTREQGVDSRRLIPHQHVDEHDFFPGDFVSDKREPNNLVRYGMVVSVDGANRMARIQWYRPSTNGERAEITGVVEECSVYELADHPDHRFRHHQLVLRIAEDSMAGAGAATAGQVLYSDPSSGQLCIRWSDATEALVWPQAVLSDLQEMSDLEDEDDSSDSDSASSATFSDEGSVDSENSWETEEETEEGATDLSQVGVQESASAFVAKARRTRDAAMQLEVALKGCEVWLAGAATDGSDTSRLQLLNWLRNGASAGSQHVAHGIPSPTDLADMLHLLRDRISDLTELATSGSLLVLELRRNLRRCSRDLRRTAREFRIGMLRVSALVAPLRSSEQSLCSSLEYEDILNQARQLAVESSRAPLKMLSTVQQLLNDKVPHLDSAFDFESVVISGSVHLLGSAARQLMASLTHWLLGGSTTAALVNFEEQGSSADTNNYTIDDPMDCSRPPTPLPENPSAMLRGTFVLQVDAPGSHRFINEAAPSGSSLRILSKAWRRDIALLETSLPVGAVVKAYESRMDLLSVLLRGPADTPYEDGLFIFEIQLSHRYPEDPPRLVYLSCCSGRLNPNLYEDGKVCVSLLGTWAGKDSEMWSPRDSNLLQVIVSIQGLILVAEPYYNEAGYDRHRGTTDGLENSKKYNEMAAVKTVESLATLARHPPSVFREEIQQHLAQHGERILDRLAMWHNLTETSKNIVPPDFPLYPVSRGFQITLTSAMRQLREVIAELLESKEC